MSRRRWAMRTTCAATAGRRCKISLNKYLQGFGTSFAIVPDPNPVSAAVGFGNATRTWDDRNHNYIPDCDLSNKTPGANGECGALSDPNFGSNDVAALLNQLKFDPNLQNGLRQTRVQLGVLRGRAAAARQPDVARHRLLPPLVRQLPGRGQPGAQHGDRFQLHQPPGSRRFAAAGRRQLHGHGFPGRQAVRGFRRLRHERERRQAVGRRRPADLSIGTAWTSTSTPGCRAASSPGADSAPGARPPTTATSSRLLPEVAYESNNFFSPYLLHHDPDAVLQTGWRVPHAGQGERRLQHSEDRRVGRRHLPGPARRAPSRLASTHRSCRMWAACRFFRASTATTSWSPDRRPAAGCTSST